MKPQRRLALAEEIGSTLAKAQLSTLDGSGAAAALGATACSGFKEVGHPGRIFRTPRLIDFSAFVAPYVDTISGLGAMGDGLS
jgi:hypothetical protein